MKRSVFLTYIILLCFFVIPKASFAFWGYSSLSRLTNAAAGDLKEKVGIKKVHLEIDLIMDTKTGETSNLSTYLVNEFEASFSNAGLSLVDDPENSDFIINSGYQRSEGVVTIFVKFRSKDGSSYNSLMYKIKEEKLPADCFIDSIETKAYKLANKIVQNQRGLIIFVNPIVKADVKFSSPFSDYMTQKIKNNMITWGENQIISEKPKIAKLSNTRGLKRKVKTMKNIASSDAYFTGASAVIEGKYYENADDVIISLSLKDLNGLILATTDETIDKSIINMSLKNPDAEKISMIADVTNELHGDMVKISTTKGSQFQVYYSGESIRFNILVGQPLYVYIYSINSKKEVDLLYPYEGDSSRLLMPNNLYTLPAEEDDWEIVVEKPFGLDIVKVFASDKQLPVPSFDANIASRSFEGSTRALRQRKKAQADLSQQKIINHLDLVDFYKGVSQSLNAHLYEDSIFVETKER